MNGLGHLEPAVVEVQSAKHRGTGFFVHHNLVVTCAHVARSNSVAMRTAQGSSFRGKVLARFPDTSAAASWELPDIALIQTEMMAEAFFQLGRHRNIDEKPAVFFTAGFVVGPAETPSLCYERLRMGPTEPVHGARVARLLDCQIGHGMSGAPIVMSDNRTVVGVVKRSRSVDSNAGGWAIPIWYLDSHFQQWIRPVREAVGRDSIEVYLADLAESSSTIEPRGMRRNREAQDIVFPLDDVYLSLVLRNYGAPELGLSDKVEFETQAPYLTVDQLEGVDGTTSENIDELSISELLNKGQPTVILGSPGAGKSTLLQWIALANARAMLRQEPRVEVAERHLDPESTSSRLIDLGPARLPVVVRLTDYDLQLSIAESTGESLGLWKFICNSVARAAGSADTEVTEVLAEAKRDGSLVIALDGMDELKDGASRVRIRNAIIALREELFNTRSQTQSKFSEKGLSTLPSSCLIISSRHAGYRDVSLPPSGYDHAVIQALNDSAVRRFLFNWSYAVRKWSQDASGLGSSSLARQAWRRSSEIDAALFSRVGLRSIARTPLLLTVIALVYDELGRLPRQRFDLLHEMSRILVERRDTQSSVFDALDLLGPVAKWLHSERPSGLMTRDEFLALVRRHMSRLSPDYQGGSKLPSPNQFCADAEEQFGLIVERGPDLLGFQHRTIQEFFVAIEIGSWADDPFEIVRPMMADPHWREVIILLVGHEAKAGAARCRRLLEWMLEVDASWLLGIPQVLTLVADSLAEVERALPEIESAVITRLINLYCSVSLEDRPDSSDLLSRLKVQAERSPHTFDIVVSRILYSSSHIIRTLLCDLLVALELDLPLTVAALSALDGEPGRGLAERRAYIELGDRRLPLPSSPLTDRLLNECRGYLLQFGPSRALDVVVHCAAELDLGIERETVIEAARMELLKLANESVGFEAVLAGTASAILDPDILGAVVEAFSDRQLIDEQADVLLWAIANRRIPDEQIMWWRELSKQMRLHILWLSVLRSSFLAAAPLAWQELADAHDIRHSPDVVDCKISLPERQLVDVSLYVLTRLRAPLVDSHRVLLLNWVIDSSPATRTGVRDVLASSRCRSSQIVQDILQIEIENVHLEVQEYIEILGYENVEIDRNALIGLSVLHQHHTGLWRPRAQSILMKQKMLGAVRRDALGEALSAVPGLDLQEPMWDVFLNSIVVDQSARVNVLLEEFSGSHALNYLFTQCSSEVLDAIRSYANRPSHSEARDTAQDILLVKHYQGANDALYCEKLEKTTVSSLLASHDGETTERFCGASLARSLLSDGHSPEFPWRDVLAGFPRARAEFCFALVNADEESSHQAARDRLIFEAVSDTVGVSSRLVEYLRLISVADDHGIGALQLRGLSEVETARAVLKAGSHPAPWLSRGREIIPSACHDGLVGLALLLCQDASFLRVFLATLSRTLTDSTVDWPEIRFSLDVLVELASTMPDAVRSAAGAYGLLDAVTDQFEHPDSFGVRLRAFQCSALLGTLTKDMVLALRSASTDLGVVGEAVFTSLVGVQHVRPDAGQALLDAVAGGGLPGLGALDAVRQLMGSEALSSDPVLRLDLLNGLIGAHNQLSAYEVCLPPYGLYLNLKDLVRKTVRVGLGMQDEAGDRIRPYILERPTAAAISGTAGQIRADAEFSEVFLQRVRHHLLASGGGSV